MTPNRALPLLLALACLPALAAAQDTVLARPSRRAPGAADAERSRRDLREGLARLDAGQAARALDLLRESVRLAPGAAGFEALGRAYERLGRRFKAVHAYRRSLRYAPDPALGARITALERGEAEELRESRSRSGPGPKPEGK